MEAEVNGVRYYKGKSLADLPPEISPKTYDSGRGTGNTTAETNLRTIRVPVEVSGIFLDKVRELIDSLKSPVQVDDAIVMEYHFTCTLEPKAVYQKRLELEEEQKAKSSLDLSDCWHKNCPLKKKS